MLGFMQNGIEEPAIDISPNDFHRIIWIQWQIFIEI